MGQVRGSVVLFWVPTLKEAVSPPPPQVYLFAVILWVDTPVYNVGGRDTLESHLVVQKVNYTVNSELRSLFMEHTHSKLSAASTQKNDNYFPEWSILQNANVGSQKAAGKCWIAVFEMYAPGHKKSIYTNSWKYRITILNID